jgi:hypothetical protein
MRSLTLVSIALELIGSAATAQDRRGIRFWNLMLYTITNFQTRETVLRTLASAAANTIYESISAADFATPSNR